MNTVNSKSKIRKILKYFLLFCGTVVLLFVAIALVIGFFYQDKVKKIIINELNKNLRTEITAENIEFSIFRKFPYASLSFYNITAMDATDKPNKDTLLFAENLYLNFNIIDIFKENYKIKTIDVEDAKLNLKVYSDYSDNYTFWNESTDTTDAPFQLVLKKINCKNVHVRYLHFPVKQLYDFEIEKGLLKGSLNDEIFDTDADAEIYVHKIQIDDLLFLVEKKAVLSLSLNVNNETENYNITEARLSVGNMHFDVKGTIINEPLKTDFNLFISAKEIKLPDFIEELPEQVKKHLQDYESNGIIDFILKINGKLGDNEYPLLDMMCNLKSGSLKQNKNNISLKNISVKATYTNGITHNLKSSKLILEDFNADLPQGNISGFFSVEDFNLPFVNIETNARINLAEFVKFVHFDVFHDIGGSVDVNIMFSGKIKNLSAFTPEDFINSKCHGKALLTDGFFVLKENINKKFNNIHGNFQFNNNDIIIDELNLVIGASDFNLKGYFRNALSFIFIPSQTLNIDAGLNADNIILDELLISSIEKNDTLYNLKFPDFITYNIDVDVKKIKFARFEAQKLYGKIKLKNKILNTENLFFEAFDGQLITSLSIDGRADNLFLTQTKSKLVKTNINKIFYQLENFGQEELIDKNVKGTLTADVDLIMSFSGGLDVDLNNLYAAADITIENGELNNYEPMNALSKFTKLNDLSSIKFETLKNKIEIKDKTIHFPNMSIKSNALNVEALGTHTFDNVIDYRLKILLSELLGKKAREVKKENQEFGVVEDDGLGRTTLYLKITGNIENPVTTYDTKGVYDKNKNAVKEDLKNTIHKIGEQLFNKNDTLSKIQTPKEKLKKKKKEEEILEDFKIE